MEILIAVIATLMILAGLAGCFVPVLPGPPLAYISLLLLQIGPETPFSFKFMIIMGCLVLGITLMDYLIPAAGARIWGGSRYGMIGAMLGVLVGLFFFPPVGFVIFPFLGAMLGELINGAYSQQAFKAAVGTLLGLLFGTMLKFSVTLIIAYYFFTNL